MFKLLLLLLVLSHTFRDHKTFSIAVDTDKQNVAKIVWQNVCEELLVLHPNFQVGKLFNRNVNLKAFTLKLPKVMKAKSFLGNDMHSKLSALPLSNFLAIKNTESFLYVIAYLSDL